ncbi:serine hydrolase domain-containing protein [Fidelibacter multiformis]|uniref:serine hydrolase domain-containing protein n=1 Tax=Fidelibacter multiformis TaxID=3377529 RepID=UPI0037DD066D
MKSSNNLYLAWILLVLLVYPHSVSLFGSTQSDAHQDVKIFVQRLDQRIPEEMEKYEIPGLCIALVRNHQVVWTGAYGLADREQEIPMTTDALCRVESISKSVTAWGVMKLVEKGLIRLEDPIGLYLKKTDFPETDPDWRSVTIHQLLSHTAGFPLGSIGPDVEYPPFSKMPAPAEYLTSEIQGLHTPGQKFVYSNVGFNTLEILIEKVSGQDFSSYMTAEILLPLGMTRSGFTFSPEELPEIPSGYETDGTPVPPYVYPVHASGGLMAPIDDIARFLTAGKRGEQRVLDPESLTKIFTSHTDVKGLYGFVSDGYGYGHFVERLSDGRQAVWHGGQGHGWMTHFHLLPGSGDGIVLLTNSQRSWPFFGKVLLEWTRWLEIPPVGMSRILTASRVFLGVIILIFLAAIFLISFVIYGMIQEKYRFHPLSEKNCLKRLLSGLVGMAILALLLWAIKLPYFFLSSVFPASTPLLGYGLLLLAVGFILSSLCVAGNEERD